ncbi:MAG: hypothetical protein P1P87_10365 [Trueperaceae bacterium]|nr:hypothetical protein [Trueperaceae bacterium]
MNPTLRTILGTSLLALGLLAAIAAPVAASARPDRPFESVDVDRGVARSASVVLEVDVGRLDLRGQAAGDGRALVGVLDLGSAQTLERTVRGGEQLDVALRGHTRLRPRIVRGGAHWDLNLAADLPAALTVRSRVGETRLDLRGTAVHALELDAGIGDHEVYLPERDVVARLSTGLGDLDVFVPRGAVVRIQVEGGRALDAVPAGFVAVPGGYERDGAGAVIELTLGAGLGEARVQTY